MNKYVNDFSKIKKLCKEITDELNKTFSLSSCSQIDDISTDKLNNLPPNLITFINTGISSEIDDLIKESLDGKKMLEAIGLTFSSIIKKLDKNSKTEHLIKVHETPKSDPMLIGTKRRIELLKRVIGSSFKEKTLLWFCVKKSPNTKSQHRFFVHHIGRRS